MYSRCPLRVIFLILLTAFSYAVNGQSPGSLKEIVAKSKNGTLVFSSLVSLGKLNESSNKAKAIEYYERVLKFPFFTSYSKLFVMAYQSLGELYFQKTSMIFLFTVIESRLA
jgi:tetratricopeptide (TPR) repeat protein